MNKTGQIEFKRRKHTCVVLGRNKYWPKCTFLQAIVSQISNKHVSWIIFVVWFISCHIELDRLVNIHKGLKNERKKIASKISFFFLKVSPFFPIYFLNVCRSSSTREGGVCWKRGMSLRHSWGIERLLRSWTLVKVFLN